MSAAASLLLSQGWYPHLHEFNLLPSRLLHASWVQKFSPLGAIEALRLAFDDEAALHRHWSGYILELLGLTDRPWLDNDAPGLPLAILPPEPFEQLIAMTGTVLTGGAIRRAIRREEVAAIELSIGAQGLFFARNRSHEYHPGLDLPEGTRLSEFAPQIRVLGAGALLHAMYGSPDELFERVRLRLPIETPVIAGDMLAALPSDAALELMLRLTSEVAPEWLSFCATTN